MIGGVLAGLLILARLSALDEAVVGVLDRLFMLYLLLTFFLAVRLRTVVHALFAGVRNRRFGLLDLRLPSLLLVLSLPAVALLGLAGYLNLAWAAAWYVGAFSLVLAAWLLTRSLLNDLAVWLKNYAIRHSTYALLWTQDVINPLHRLLRIGLILGFGAVLLRLSGWHGQSAVIARMGDYLGQTLFTLGGAAISPWNLIVTGSSLLALVWLGRWIRTITYRWAFSRIADLGVRHSLSVFLQYTLVLIGLLVMLRLIGLDLTTLAVFAGAVGVGIGLGLQTTANNFISGLLLLIERPLRSGDIVKIGPSEGTVSRIGIRSTTVKTFDDLEVIIPNAEVINNAFTNWTHSDNIIRSVIMVRASHDDDPERVRKLLTSTVKHHPAVLQDPPPLALLWELADFSLLFRVQFYSDVTQANVLVVRSEIRSRIWYALQEAGIHIPYPQQDIHVREWPGEDPRERPVRESLRTGIVEPPLQCTGRSR